MKSPSFNDKPGSLKKFLSSVSWAVMISMLATIVCLHTHLQQKERRSVDTLLSRATFIQAPKQKIQLLDGEVDSAAGKHSDQTSGPTYSYSADPLTFMARKQLGYCKRRLLFLLCFYFDLCFMQFTGNAFTSGDPVLNANVIVQSYKVCISNIVSF